MKRSLGWFGDLVSPFKRMRTSWGKGWRRRTFRRRSTKPYYVKRRRYGVRAKRIRQRNRARGLKQGLRVIVRNEKTLEPDLQGQIRFNTYANKSNFKEALNFYQKIFDEYKILRIYQKFRVERSAKVENDITDKDIIHWSCYDPDGHGNKFKNKAAFMANVSSRWHIMKPYQVVTSSISPKFATQNFGYTGIPRVDNQWFDITSTDVSASQNGVQHLWEGPTPDEPTDPIQYRIIMSETIVIVFRGMRQGGTYGN